jgi:hypothetical protein
VHVDPARHDNETAGVDHSCGPTRGIRWGRHELALGNPQIADYSINAVSRIIYDPSGDFGQITHELNYTGLRTFPCEAVDCTPS